MNMGVLSVVVLLTGRVRQTGEQSKFRVSQERQNKIAKDRTGEEKAVPKPHRLTKCAVSNYGTEEPVRVPAELDVPTSKQAGTETKGVIRYVAFCVLLSAVLHRALPKQPI